MTTATALFILSKLFWTLAEPSTALVLLLVLGLLLALRRRRTGLAVAGLAAFGFAAVLVLPVDQWLLRPLENRFPSAPLPDRVDGIIVLGGAVNTALTADRGHPSLNDAAERMTEFVALANRYPQARLAFAGGSGRLFGGEVSESEVAHRLFERLGLTRPVTYDDKSRNTHENALYLRDLLQPQPGETWVLITSASHMPRSVGIFRAIGWPVLPWPVAYKTGSSLAVQYGSSLPAKLAHIDWAVHEWIGLVAYWWLGRTNALFPAVEGGGTRP